MANLLGQNPQNIRFFIKGGLEVALLNHGASLKFIRVGVGDELIDVRLQLQSVDVFVRYNKF